MLIVFNLACIPHKATSTGYSEPDLHITPYYLCAMSAFSSNLAGFNYDHTLHETTFPLKKQKDCSKWKQKRTRIKRCEQEADNIFTAN
jgi:hypothetical protein